MEQLLLVLFLVFSVVSALLKRRKQSEEAQKQEEQKKQQGVPASAPVSFEEDDDDDEEWGSWPMPPGDPFDAQPKPAATADAQVLLYELEDQARAAEERARLQDQEANQRQQQARDVRPAQKVAELIQRQRSVAKKNAGRRGPRYRFTVERAREAVVFTELLGSCKSERNEEWLW
jgi:beta-lactamase class A